MAQNLQNFFLVNIMGEEPQDPENFQIAYSNEPRISIDTFCQLFDDHSRFENFIVIDCRSAREYEGGHIKNAIRCYPSENKSNISKLYKKIWKPRSIYIFHCEYSANRGPTGLNQFTEAHNKSENKNMLLHAFVLDGGYRKFYAAHPEYCDGEYTPEGFGLLFDD